MEFLGATEQTLLDIIQEPLANIQNCAVVAQLDRVTAC